MYLIALRMFAVPGAAQTQVYIYLTTWWRSLGDTQSRLHSISSLIFPPRPFFDWRHGSPETLETHPGRLFQQEFLMPGMLLVWTLDIYWST